VAEIGGKGAVAFGDGNPPPSTKLEFRKDSSFYRGDNYFAAGGRLQVNARNAVTQALAGAPWSSNVSFAAQVSTSAPAPTSTPGVTCGTAFVSTSTSAFNVMVTTTYSYAANPLIPWIFLFNAPQLQSSATVQVQPSML
ncbi:hypothetical protein QZM69_35765, partial [Burkholderia aenigmatica]|nr:hypothetical protein [Burkholderia aenigmatica]